MTTAIAAVLFSAYVLAALFASNLLFDKTQNFVWSRKLAHALVGLAVLSAPIIFPSPLVPTALATAILLVFIATHTHEVFYGVAKRGRLSEVWFAGSCAICLGSGWFIDPWIGVASALYLAWGDGATGLARWVFVRAHAKHWSGTVTNLVVCSAIALLVDPYWVGLLGAITAVVLEHLCGDVGRIRWIDDNVASPLGALVVMAALEAIL